MNIHTLISDFSGVIGIISGIFGIIAGVRTVLRYLRTKSTVTSLPSPSSNVPNTTSWQAETPLSSSLEELPVSKGRIAIAVIGAAIGFFLATAGVIAIFFSIIIFFTKSYSPVYDLFFLLIYGLIFSLTGLYLYFKTKIGIRNDKILWRYLALASIAFSIIGFFAQYFVVPYFINKSFWVLWITPMTNSQFISIFNVAFILVFSGAFAKFVKFVAQRRWF